MQDKIIASHVTHVLVDRCMLTLKCCPEMDYKHSCDTIFAHFQGITNNIYGFGRPFFSLLHFFNNHPPPVHPYFYMSIFIFTRPNDGWTCLYINVWQHAFSLIACKGNCFTQFNYRRTCKVVNCVCFFVLLYLLFSIYKTVHYFQRNVLNEIFSYGNILEFLLCKTNLYTCKCH